MASENDRARRSVRLVAPAKINLGLDVLRRRDDGFHEIDTIFAAIDLCDEIEVGVIPIENGGRAKTISCTVTGNDLLASEPEGENLCTRAAAGFLAGSGIDDEIRISLRKRIPTGAGLGGGSADAAAVLVGLDRLFPEHISAEDRAKIAADLGSDIPFFLGSTPARGRGRGELLEGIDVDLPDLSILLVKPDLSIPTPEAYRLVGRDEPKGERDLVEELRSMLDGRPHRLTNDFEEPIASTWLDIGSILSRLRSLSGNRYVAMTGSGAACYALFDDRDLALEAEEELDDLPFCCVTSFRQSTLAD